MRDRRRYAVSVRRVRLYNIIKNARACAREQYSTCGMGKVSYGGYRTNAVGRFYTD